jgi:hypothetical protein
MERSRLRLDRQLAAITHLDWVGIEQFRSHRTRAVVLGSISWVSRHKFPSGVKVVRLNPHCSWIVPSMDNFLLSSLDSGIGSFQYLTFSWMLPGPLRGLLWILSSGRSLIATKRNLRGCVLSDVKPVSSKVDMS